MKYRFEGRQAPVRITPRQVYDRSMLASSMASAIYVAARDGRSQEEAILMLAGPRKADQRRVVADLFGRARHRLRIRRLADLASRMGLSFDVTLRSDDGSVQYAPHGKI